MVAMDLTARVTPAGRVSGSVGWKVSGWRSAGADDGGGRERTGGVVGDEPIRDELVEVGEHEPEPGTGNVGYCELAWFCSERDGLHPDGRFGDGGDDNRAPRASQSDVRRVSTLLLAGVVHVVVVLATIEGRANGRGPPAEFLGLSEASPVGAHWRGGVRDRVEP